MWKEKKKKHPTNLLHIKNVDWSGLSPAPSSDRLLLQPIRARMEPVRVAFTRGQRYIVSLNI